MRTARTNKAAAAAAAAALPISWSIDHWPPDIYPGSPTRGRYVCRMNRASLMAAGALARVGRDLVVIGAGYARWLQRKTADVPGFANGAARDSSLPPAA